MNLVFIYLCLVGVLGPKSWVVSHSALNIGMLCRVLGCEFATPWLWNTLYQTQAQLLFGLFDLILLFGCQICHVIVKQKINNFFQNNYICLVYVKFVRFIFLSCFKYYFGQNLHSHKTFYSVGPRTTYCKLIVPLLWCLCGSIIHLLLFH